MAYIVWVDHRTGCPHVIKERDNQGLSLEMAEDVADLENSVLKQLNRPLRIYVFADRQDFARIFMKVIGEGVLFGGSNA